MDDDFGLLVDFLRGELDDSQAGPLRRRLESEPELFQRFEKLRRTLSLLKLDRKPLSHMKLRA